MGFPRKKFAAAAVGGRYSSPVVVPDRRWWRNTTQMRMCGAWCLMRLGEGPSGNEGSVCASRAAGAEAAHVYASSMDLYDVAARVWLRSRAVPGGGCVVAACGANGNVYILSSHAVELSFWKFQRKKDREWSRRCRRRLDWTAR
ncbi:UNVERIFIED_CONTAM: F-box/kelch-repeat protein [Sesamum radiatum]|uniref:F-box/kelch-repeat protein n=1 Tax=Sesamum radiatum TaxID=300843 RepID=A0AAW2W4Y1_SESRA